MWSQIETENQKTIANSSRWANQMLTVTYQVRAMGYDFFFNVVAHSTTNTPAEK